MKSVALRQEKGVKYWLLVAIIPGVLFFPAGVSGQSLDPTNFIVVGGGLSAGFSDFQLTTRYQDLSYPKLMAGQMNTIMPQPTFRPITPPAVVAFNPLPATLPPTHQTVLRGLPFPLFAFNLSVPFFKVAESFSFTPSTPLVLDGDLNKTFANMILGYPLLLLEDPPSWTQVEYAEVLAPTFIVIQMGFGDVLDAALNNDPALITPASSFSTDYSALVSRLQGTFATTLLMTVPTPTLTAYFIPLEEAAASLGVDPSGLADRFSLGTADWLTIGGLVEAGQQLEQGGDQLSPDSVLSGGTAAAIAGAVASYNTLISGLAAQNNLLLFDLEAFLQEVEDSGLEVGSRHLGADYLEGFYSRDGLFPGVTGHAVLANRLLALLNSRFSTNYPLVDAQAIADDDELLVTETFGASAGSSKKKAKGPRPRGLKP